MGFLDIFIDQISLKSYIIKGNVLENLAFFCLFLYPEQ